MEEVFTLEERIHHVGEPGCPGCAEGYPERCPCGGLVHASESAAETEAEIALTTRCDRCGRTNGDLAEQVA